MKQILQVLKQSAVNAIQKAGATLEEYDSLGDKAGIKTSVLEGTSNRSRSVPGRLSESLPLCQLDSPFTAGVTRVRVPTGQGAIVGKNVNDLDHGRFSSAIFGYACPLKLYLVPPWKIASDTVPPSVRDLRRQPESTETRALRLKQAGEKDTKEKPWLPRFGRMWANGSRAESQRRFLKELNDTKKSVVSASAVIDPDFHSNFRGD